MFKQNTASYCNEALACLLDEKRCPVVFPTDSPRFSEDQVLYDLRFQLMHLTQRSQYMEVRMLETCIHTLMHHMPGRTPTTKKKLMSKLSCDSQYAEEIQDGARTVPQLCSCTTATKRQRETEDRNAVLGGLADADQLVRVNVRRKMYVERRDCVNLVEALALHGESVDATWAEDFSALIKFAADKSRDAVVKDDHLCGTTREKQQMQAETINRSALRIRVIIMFLFVFVLQRKVVLYRKAEPKRSEAHGFHMRI